MIFAASAYLAAVLGANEGGYFEGPKRCLEHIFDGLAVLVLDLTSHLNGMSIRGGQV